GDAGRQERGHHGTLVVVQRTHEGAQLVEEPSGDGVVVGYDGDRLIGIGAHVRPRFLLVRPSPWSCWTAAPRPGYRPVTALAPSPGHSPPVRSCPVRRRGCRLRPFPG